MQRLGLLGIVALAAAAEEFPRGAIVPEVRCAAEASQSYALYLPSGYAPERVWPVILAFDPRARGLTPVERYREAAETYGYIVVGSNNSRNGSWEASMAAVRAMSADIGQRFAIDPKRIYTAGMSGGARVAMGVALGTSQIAGVIASSAGYPDAQPRKTLNFAVFGTAGTEDFNYREMRELDRRLTSPHRLAIFDGGHVWLSPALALEAVEWMELQAMQSGRKPREDRRIDALFAKRTQAANGLGAKEQCLALEALVEDFRGLRDTTALASRAAALRHGKDVREGFKKERVEEEREDRTVGELQRLEISLADAERRASSLTDLRFKLNDLSKQATASEDSPGRRSARRILRGIMAGSSERTRDPEYRKLLDGLRQLLPRPADGRP